MLNSLINSEVKEKGGKLYVCFIDFKTAFDAIHGEEIIKKFFLIGIRGKLLET